MASQLIINDPPLLVPPSLAQKIGLNEAIILQQVHYWLNPKFNKNYHEDRYWVWNTYEQWQQQFPFWCEKTISRTIANLEKLNLLDSFMTRDFRKHKYYTINYQKLDQLNDEMSPKTAERQGSRPSGHIDQIERTNCPDRSEQNVLIDRDKVTRSLTENTSEITPLPPLTPPSQLPESSFSSPDSKEEEEEEGEDLEKMICVWNKTVQPRLNPGQNASLTPKRVDSLKTFLATVLRGNFQDWGDYCVQISHCRFLLGENPSGFKVSLDWALNVDNAYKVLEGAIYDKPAKSLTEPPADPSVEGLMAELRENAPVGPFTEEWLQVCPKLIQSLGPRTFRSWFLNTGFSDLGPDFAIIQVQGNFRKNYIETHFKAQVKQTLQSLYPTLSSVEFRTIPTNGDLA